MLLKAGIDSARMTTDRGVDLVAYCPGTARAVTIQVKCKEKPVLAGGKGKHTLSWNLVDGCPAELTFRNRTHRWIRPLASITAIQLGETIDEAEVIMRGGSGRKPKPSSSRSDVRQMPRTTSFGEGLSEPSFPEEVGEKCLNGSSTRLCTQPRS